MARKEILMVGMMRVELSQNEVAVLRWLSLGKRYDEIAQLLEISQNAVSQRAHGVMEKLGANTAAGAVGMALRSGLIK